MPARYLRSNSKSQPSSKNNIEDTEQAATCKKISTPEPAKQTRVAKSYVRSVECETSYCDNNNSPNVLGISIKTEIIDPEYEESCSYHFTSLKTEPKLNINEEDDYQKEKTLNAIPRPTKTLKPNLGRLKKTRGLKKVKIEYDEDVKQENEKITLKRDNKKSPYFVKKENEVDQNDMKRLKWEPDNWISLLNNIREMRKHQDAPVDTMGCDEISDRSSSPEVSIIYLRKNKQTEKQLKTKTIKVWLEFY